jgi:hypothetical protein
MKLYERLGDKGFHTSIVTTFGVDFDAYETIALSRFRGSGCHNNLLVVDRGMLAHALWGASALPRFAGRHYRVSEAFATGVFHPKLFLQLGRRQGRVVIASANATASGLAGNLELAGIIECDQNDSPEQRFIAAAWQYAGRFFDRNQRGLNQQMSWTEQRTPWLRATRPAEGLIKLSDGTAAEFLATTGNSGILDRFVAGVTSDKIRRLIVISPYWDDDLSALRDLHARLQPQQTLLLIDKQRALFPNTALDDLDNVHLVDIGAAFDGRFVHAKLFLAQSKNSDHAVFGSANCTFAALGRSDVRGLNEECCMYRRVPAGVISRALLLDRLIEEAGFIDPSDLPPCHLAEALPLTDLANSSPGIFELYYDNLTWRPSPIFQAEDVEIELLAADLSVLQRWLQRREAVPGGEIHVTLSDLRARPSFGRVRTADGNISALAIVSVADVLRGELREAGNKSIDGIVYQLEEETEEGLWLLDILDRLETEAAPETQPGSIRQSREVASKTDSQQQFQTVDYHKFVEGRHLRSQSFEAARNSLAGTELSLVRAFLNRVISLESADPSEQVEDEELEFVNAMDLGDDVEDAGPLLVSDNRRSRTTPPETSCEPRRASRQKQNQKQIDRATTKFIEHIREVAENRELTSRDLLRLQAMLRIVIAAGLPCTQTGSGGNKAVDKHSVFRVLPGMGGELTWPRLLGKLLFAVFGGPNPVIERLKIEALHDQVPDDFLECWACCFWAIHARVQAERGKPVRGAEALLEGIYRYSGLTKEDRDDQRVTNVMNSLGDKFAARLGLSHEEIMRAHATSK